MKKKMITILGCIVILAAAVCVYFWQLPYIEFTTTTPVCEIDEEFDALSIVAKVRKESIEKISVDAHELDVHKLGTYKIIYTLLDRSYEIEVTVKDTIAPAFDVVDGETDVGVPIDPSDLVIHVTDATEVTVTFKNEVSFEKEGDYDWMIAAVDEGGNVTEKSVHVHILPKDETAPVISGAENLTIYKGASFDPMADMSVSDNQDKNVTLTIVSNDVNTAQAGTYSVIFEAADRSGNKASFTKTVKVIEKASGNVVYLTFDDGPSYNTPKVLDILDRYHIKATFFVTHLNPDYSQYIAAAYQKGHTIGLHTYTHDYSKVYASAEAYWDDLNKISSLVESLTGYRSPYVRFPGGSSNTVSRNYCKGIMSILAGQLHQKGYEYFDWNVSSGDAAGNYVAVEKIIENATGSSYGKAMILFHDANGKDTTVEALPAVIEYYLSKGYTFKTVDETTHGFHHGFNN